MDLIATLVSVPAIVGAVNLLKTYGLPSQWAPVLSVVFGGVFAAVASYVQYGSFDNIAAMIMVGIVTGLSASGVYDLGHKPVEVDQPVPIEIDQPVEVTQVEE